ncbi:MAG: ATP-binding protein [Desulfatibacillaceae bacterium]
MGDQTSRNAERGPDDTRMTDFKQWEERELRDHETATMRAGRSIIRLARREQDADGFLRGACHVLVAEGSYEEAWMVLADDGGGMDTLFVCDSSNRVDTVKPGDFHEETVRRALASPGSVVKGAERRGEDDESTGCMASALGGSADIRGIVCVTVKPELAAKPETMEFFAELADDLDFALTIRMRQDDAKRSRNDLAWEAGVNSAMAELSEALIRSAPIETISDLVLEQAKKLTSSTLGFVGYIDPEQGHFVSTTMTRDIWENCKVPDKSIVFEHFSGLWGWVLDNRATAMTNDPASDPRSTGIPDGHTPIQRFLSAPSMLGDRLMGQVTLANPSRDYTEQDLVLVERLASLHALALGRKWDEEELIRVSEARAELEHIVNLSPVVIYLLRNEPGWPVEFVSSNVDFLGYSARDFVSGAVRFQDLVHPGDKTEVEKTMASPGAVDHLDDIQLTYRITAASGETRWVEDRRWFRTNDRGDVTHAQGILADITERHLSEQALRESEQKYRMLFANVHEAVLLMDASNWSIVDANPAAAVLYGYAHDEFIGVDARSLFSDENSAGILGEDMSTSYFRSFPVVWQKRKDAAEFPALLSAGKFDWLGREVICAIVRDETERMKTEEERIKAKKIEVAGQFASGIVHDFNNLLGVVLGNVSMALMESSPGDFSYERLVDAEAACMRAKDLTQKYLTFARGGESRRRAISVAGVVRDTSSLCLSGSNVACDYQTEENLWAVEADASQLQHALNEILKNAQESMPEGGTVSIRTENVEITENGMRAGEYVRVTISDRGPGIPEEDRHRIFDPYFTTKGQTWEKGKGLGLTTAYSLISRHGGYIRVESETGSGTSVQIYLPASGVSRAPSPPTDGRERPSRRVLVMDDEEMMRGMARRMLVKLGYEVDVAETGEQALEILHKARESGRPFDAAIFDLTVKGGMGGTEAMERTAGISPETRVILSSGYTADPAMSNYLDFGFDAAIAKPYVMKDLGRLLDKVLGGNS